MRVIGVRVGERASERRGCDEQAMMMMSLSMSMRRPHSLARCLSCTTTTTTNNDLDLDLICSGGGRSWWSLSSFDITGRWSVASIPYHSISQPKYLSRINQSIDIIVATMNESLIKQRLLQAWRSRTLPSDWATDTKSLASTTDTDLDLVHSLLLKVFLQQLSAGPAPSPALVSYLAHALANELVSLPQLIERLYVDICTASATSLTSHLKHKPLLHRAYMKLIATGILGLYCMSSHGMPSRHADSPNLISNVLLRVQIRARNNRATMNITQTRLDRNEIYQRNCRSPSKAHCSSCYRYKHYFGEYNSTTTLSRACCELITHHHHLTDLSMHGLEHRMSLKRSRVAWMTKRQ